MMKKYLEFEKNLNKLKMLLLTAACSTVLLFTGCQSQDESSNNVYIETNQSVDDKTTENDESDVAEDITPTVTEDSSEESTVLFSDLSKYQFVFASGVGAWQTMLTINEDGIFAGEYYDSEMGTVGEDYPNGVVYSSTFEGKFTEPKKVNDYTYSVLIEYINLEKEVENEEIIDGIKYIYSEPNGINDAKEILIYTPEAPVKELPEGFRSWTRFVDLDDLKDEYLGFYGLYNVETESGFSSYKLDGEE
ncbi:hypothetical protein SPSYN_02927 [Sporotomaculum syntrophicum]|uniref:Uncharacterized protein n=1 Tax=Sporotomaculum syntrophicum TaxID=182264 RepID=A0A9D2WMA3_9FIRM|nr:hypothetical protein [Sporotomaculum syntrophicum]KAF1084015.1 hypothetical protein SPSYN_02927 [Sporotomaculum syntrophicum]